MPNDPIALGQAVSSKNAAMAISKSRLSDEERINILEQQVAHMSKIIAGLKNKDKQNTNAYQHTAGHVNKDGLPVGIMCYGVTSKYPFPIFLGVEENGYMVGATLYDSLSAAAEAVSGVRRSGWTFWKLNDGTTLKEAFKDR